MQDTDCLIKDENGVVYITEAQLESMSSRNERLQLCLSQLQNVKRIGDQDKNKFAALVNKAKGPNRSMRQFAIELGKNPTQLSRAINGQLKGGCPNDLLALIAIHADPESGVTLEDLMKANGQIPRGSLRETRLMQEAEFSKKCRRTLSGELIQRGYTVTSIESEPFVTPAGRLRFDFVLNTNAIERGAGRWAFEFKFSGGNELDSHKHPVGTGSVSRMVSQIMASFYTGSLHADKVSIVVGQRALFEQIKLTLQDYRIPDLLSIILVDTLAEKVTDEFTLQTTDGCQPKEVFFPVPDKQIVEDTVDWDTDDFED